MHTTELRSNALEALGEFLNYVSRVAVAIRLNSAYRQGAENTYSKYDVMWLSDSLHNLNMLGNALQGKQDLEWSVDRLINTYKAYLGDGEGMVSNPKETYSRYQPLDIGPERAIAILENIKGSFTEKNAESKQLEIEQS